MKTLITISENIIQLNFIQNQLKNSLQAGNKTPVNPIF